MGFWSAVGDFLQGMANTAEYQRSHAAKMADLQAQIERRYAKEEEARLQRLGRVAIRAYQRSRQSDAQRGRDLQYQDEDCKIQVKNGYQWKGDMYTTDIMVIDRHSPKGAGWHVVFDEDGNVLHQGWKSRRG